MLVGAVGVEPTINGLKDPKFIQRVQPTPVTNNRISDGLKRFNSKGSEYLRGQVSDRG
jgi:hypothetical protein